MLGQASAIKVRNQVSEYPPLSKLAGCFFVPWYWLQRYDYFFIPPTIPFVIPLYYTSDIIFIPPPPLPFIPLPRLPLFRFRHHPPSTAPKSMSSTSASRHRRHRLTDVDDVDLEGVEQRGKRMCRYRTYIYVAAIITPTAVP